jgi:hypothetical protein
MSVRERGALGPVLIASGAILALTLVTVCAGLSEAPQAFRGGAPASQVREQQPNLKPQSVALQERDVIVGSLASSPVPQQVLVARGRARLQAHAQSVLRLLRERQDAIIMAFSHRMRDASKPGATSHVADRPLIVTRPLRGPPALT